MASTSRDVTTGVRGANPSLLFFRGQLLYRVSPFTLTHPENSCQGRAPWESFLPTVLLALVSRASDLASALHTTSGGSTVSLFDGNLLGQPRYAVSIYPERTLVLSRAPSHLQLFNFIADNLDVLLIGGRALGTWRHEDKKRHSLDVVVCPSDRAVALELGMLYGQNSIFDLEAEREISILPRVRTMPLPGINASR